MNVLKAKVQTANAKATCLSIDDGRTTIDAATDGAGVPVGADCGVGIRPEHLSVSDPLSLKLQRTSNGPIKGTVIATEMLGSETIVFASLQSGENVTASIRGIHSLPQGSAIHFGVSSRFVHVFDEKGGALPSLRPWREDYLEA
jgi:sn-glycerol 3-phosphate transport system ATP-binding protein